MSRKFSRGGCSNDDVDYECTVYKNHEPETFSNFVDKIVGNLPVCASHERPSFSHLRDPNNPIEVLKNKGLLDISRNSARTGDGSSQVDVRFYTEESRLGETVKVFSSKHSFRNGKLVFSSTQELIPDLPQDIQKLNDWWNAEVPRCRSAIRNQSVKSETIYNKSERRKLSDIVRDAEKQSVIRRYESAAEKRHRYCRSASPRLCVSGERDNRSERYLHTLRSRNIQRRVPPVTFRVTSKSPDRFLHHAAYTRTPSKSASQQPIQFKSLSEISLSSEESSVYSSPDKTIERSSRYNVKYRRTITPPKPKVKQDLFVIPRHTCHKGTSREIHRSPQTCNWDTICHVLMSPRFKSSLYYQKRPMSEQGKRPRDQSPERNFKECRWCAGHQKFTKSSTHGQRIKSRERFKACCGRENCRCDTSPRSILRQKSRKQSLPSHAQVKFRPVDTAHLKKPSKTAYRFDQKEIKDQSYYPSKNRQSCKSPFKKDSRHRTFEDSGHDKLKHGIREKMPAGVEESSETRSDSEGSTQTFPFYPSDDTGSERGTEKQHDSSGGSQTSVCTLFYKDDKARRTPRSKSYNKSRYQKSTEERKRHREENKEGIYKHAGRLQPKSNKGTKISGDEQKLKPDQQSEKKLAKTKRLINPNKIVHFEDTGKRLSQYYSTGGATLDSDKAFGDEEKIHSKKITLSNCSPRRDQITCYAKLHRKDDDKHKITFAKESINNMRQRFIGDQLQGESVIHELINKEALQEYREKFASNSSREKIMKTPEEQEYDEYQLTTKVKRRNSIRLSKTRQRERCEACKIESILDISN